MHRGAFGEQTKGAGCPPLASPAAPPGMRAELCLDPGAGHAGPAGLAQGSGPGTEWPLMAVGKALAPGQDIKCSVAAQPRD